MVKQKHGFKIASVCRKWSLISKMQSFFFTSFPISSLMTMFLTISTSCDNDFRVKVEVAIFSIVRARNQWSSSYNKNKPNKENIFTHSLLAFVALALSRCWINIKGTCLLRKIMSPAVKQWQDHRGKNYVACSEWVNKKQNHLKMNAKAFLKCFSSGLFEYSYVSFVWFSFIHYSAFSAAKTM